MLKKVIILITILSLYNCEDIIAVEDISEETITILAPTNNITLENSSINFAWQPIEYAEIYQLQIVTPNFEASQQIIEDTLIIVSSFNKVLLANDYQWRVKAINFAYETPFTTQNLTVEE
ncbi:hypothetical protein A9Q86_01530 [Flavobacteriales bacterium 33_180_T64]|mgnify:CR=1 FL=1|nr:hypothetical protein A9Q86_01530 [Flavobacteriales bacterium 33_180_T64]